MAGLSQEERARYRAAGWVAPETPLDDRLLAPIRAVAARLGADPPWQELLSGVHNPYGHHACLAEAWQFLDIAESDLLLDRVEAVLGPDIVLWDSELYLEQGAYAPGEWRHWPVDPLAGTIVCVALATGRLRLVDVTRLAEVGERLAPGAGAVYALRYMPASAHFNRDPRHPANRLAAEARVLVNYARRPLWLVRGTDRADNDFVTGFSTPVAQWSGAGSLPAGDMAFERARKGA